MQKSGPSAAAGSGTPASGAEAGAWLFTEFASCRRSEPIASKRSRISEGLREALLESAGWVSTKRHRLLQSPPRTSAGGAGPQTAEIA
jgi:hypothetical protein